MEAKVYLICGKICSGKGYYTRQLQEKTKAVVLGCDELSYDLFRNNLGEHHDLIMGRAQKYLHKKTLDIVRAGCPVILDWGFWTAEGRAEVTAYYKENGIPFEWHYIDISEEDWMRNIASRNAAVAAGATTDYAMDEGLMQKLLSRFQAPDPEEMDVWYINRR